MKIFSSLFLLAGFLVFTPLSAVAIEPIDLPGTLTITPHTLYSPDPGDTIWDFVYSGPECEIDGVIYKPEGGPYPGVVISHGGGADAARFALDPQKRIAQDYFATTDKYVSIATNYTHAGSGNGGNEDHCGGGVSVGNGASWENVYRAIKVIDILQSQELIDAVGEVVDQERIFMYGNSMGGFVTMATVSQVGDRVMAAAMTASGYHSVYAPANVPPVTANAVITPYLAMNATVGDGIQPWTGGRDWTNDVAANETDAKFVGFDSGGHGIHAHPTTKPTVIRLMLDWFADHSLPYPTATPMETSGDLDSDADVDVLDYLLAIDNFIGSQLDSVFVINRVIAYFGNH